MVYIILNLYKVPVTWISLCFVYNDSHVESVLNKSRVT